MLDEEEEDEEERKKREEEERQKQEEERRRMRSIAKPPRGIERRQQSPHTPLSLVIHTPNDTEQVL